MSTRLKKREERILQVMEQLASESARGTLIIVEGRKDIIALRALAVKGKMLSAKTGGKSLVDVISEVEETRKQEVILLMDFDRRGREMTKMLKQNLEKNRITPNLTFWIKLSSLVKKEVKDVEGLASYMITLKRKIGILHQTRCSMRPQS